ncbi:unnamed protein product [Thlaspi arvense]|uniref:Cytochrome P450 n=1 Tax=Thlaspi arvense TaxID=13288 RepID=A0AAU9SMP4_THLAR|nr:unnamed protein product [Thlaspi arvense]
MVAMNSVDLQNCLIFIFICIFSLLCYSLFFNKPKDSRGFKLPPSPPSLPIIGHLHLLLSTLIHKSLQKISSKYRPLLTLRIFNVPVVLISSGSMALAYEIFFFLILLPKAKTKKLQRVGEEHQNKRKNWNKGSNRIEGLLSTAGKERSLSLIVRSTSTLNTRNRFMRKLVATKLLRPQAIEQSQGIRAEELHRFYANLLDKANKKENVEIGKEVMKLTNNIICRMSMGRTCSEENSEAEKFRELVTKSMSFTKKIFFANMLRRPLEKLGISLRSWEFDEFLERILVEHEEKLEVNQDKDMLDLLFEAYRDQKAEYDITRNQIKSLLLEIFLGGTDTSTQATQWTMAEVVNNPNILRKLREEIDFVVGTTRLIQESDLPNLPYLQAVVKEGLRMYPISPLLRTFRESCEIQGFYIPQETILVVNVYAVMSDPDSWEDPDEFKPERFLASSRSGQQGEKRERHEVPSFWRWKERLSWIKSSLYLCRNCNRNNRINGDKVKLDETVVGMSLKMAYPLKRTPVSRLHPFNF